MPRHDVRPLPCSCTYIRDIRRHQHARWMQLDVNKTVSTTYKISSMEIIS